MQSTISTFRDKARPVISDRLNAPAWVVLVELFIGFGWIRAAVEKIIDPAWWQGNVLEEFIAVNSTDALGWYQWFLAGVVSPQLLAISAVVVIAQVIAGASLISGRRVTTGLLVGMFLNLNFIAAGSVNPSIFYLVCQSALLLAMAQDLARTGVVSATLRAMPTVSLVLVATSLPFVSTIEPSAAVEDPALVLLFFGLLLGVSSRLGVHNATLDALQPAERPISAGGRVWFGSRPRHEGHLAATGQQADVVQASCSASARNRSVCDGICRTLQSDG
ncbi:MAG: hypothetical protein KJO18_03950 [Acidimicrobiia bacterium]|nr:hypothetical protein [Acidimicrobiia bacterium]